MSILARDAAHRPGVRLRRLFRDLDTRPDLAMADAQIGAEPAHHQRHLADIWQLILELVERDLPVGAALRGVQILGDGLAGIDADDAVVLVDELARARNERHRPHQLLEIVDRAEHLEIELRQPVAEIGKRHGVEHDIGGAAIGRRLVAAAFLAGDQPVGVLVLVAAIDPDRVVGLVELLTVGPDAPDARDFPFADGIGRVGVIAVLDALHGFALALRVRAWLIEDVLAAFRLAAAGRLGGDDHVLFEARRPDELTGQPHTPIDARQRRTLARRAELEVEQARALVDTRLSRGVRERTEQRLVDDGAADRAERAAECRAGERRAENADAARQERAADRRPNRSKNQCRHQNDSPSPRWGEGWGEGIASW